MPNRLFPTVDDEEKLIEIYKQLPDRKELSMSSEIIIEKIGWRIYTEWCMSEAKGRSTMKHDFYQGEAFQKFFNDEVHFLLERQYLSGKRQNPRAESHEDYLNVRRQVLTGLVKCGVDRLKNYFGRTYDWNIDDNLRRDLKPWIGE